MCVNLCEFMCTTCWRAIQRLEEALDASELKLQPVLKCPLGAWKQTWILCKNSEST